MGHALEASKKDNKDGPNGYRPASKPNLQTATRNPTYTRKTMGRHKPTSPMTHMRETTSLKRLGESDKTLRSGNNPTIP